MASINESLEETLLALQQKYREKMQQSSLAEDAEQNELYEKYKVEEVAKAIRDNRANKEMHTYYSQLYDMFGEVVKAINVKYRMLRQIDRNEYERLVRELKEGNKNVDKTFQ